MIEDLFSEEISGTNKHFQQMQFIMTLSPFSVIQRIPQETKLRDNISDGSRSISNNSSQAQDFIIPDILINSPNHKEQELKVRSLFIVELGM